MRDSTPGVTPQPSRHAGGVFRIQAMQPGVYMIDVDAPGYVKLAAGPFEVGMNNPELVIRMQSGVGIAGVVKDQRTGKPVVGARASLFRRTRSRDVLRRGSTAATDFRELFSTDQNRDLHAFGTGIATTRADGRGAFDFGPQRPGRYIVRVTSRDHLRATIDDIELETDVRSRI